MATPPKLADLGFKGPVFLRKLPRKNSWGDAGTPSDLRTTEVVRVVFLRDPKPYSLFRAVSDDDFRRITMGINGGRSSLKEEVAYIPILPEELAEFAIDVVQGAGDTLCRAANRIHFDMPADETQLNALCKKLIDNARPVISLRRNQLADWESMAKAEGCLADRNSIECKVADCQKAALAR
jgi:hypothetical protein